MTTRIVVAEDDPKQSRLLKVYLEREGHSVLTVGNGRAALEAARKARVRIAMDDFGTRDAGLEQLRGQTFDLLKIDRSLVEHLLKDPTADRLIRGIAALASVLRARTVAEGVETAAQAFFLHAAGIDYGQGWFWSKALPPEELPRAMEGGFGDRQRELLALLVDQGPMA